MLDLPERDRIMQTDVTQHVDRVEVITGHDLSPGTGWAWLIGCACPAAINRHGLGIYVDREGDRKFWISSDCPLHGIKAKP